MTVTPFMGIPRRNTEILMELPRKLGAEPADRTGLLMRCLPRLRPEPHFGWLVPSTNAVDSEEQWCIAIFSICDGETGIGAGDNDVAITD
jgi:hypothetical protein